MIPSTGKICFDQKCDLWPTTLHFFLFIPNVTPESKLRLMGLGTCNNNVLMDAA